MPDKQEFVYRCFDRKILADDNYTRTILLLNKIGEMVSHCPSVVGNEHSSFLARGQQN